MQVMRSTKAKTERHKQLHKQFTNNSSNTMTGKRQATKKHGNSRSVHIKKNTKIQTEAKLAVFYDLLINCNNQMNSGHKFKKSIEQPLPLDQEKYLFNPQLY